MGVCTREQESKKTKKRELAVGSNSCSGLNARVSD